MKLQKGFTLIEALLVSVIIGGIMIMSVRYYAQQFEATQMDRSAAQFQEILNAGLNYYVNNSAFPPDVATLQTDGYLPATMRSPWGSNYAVVVTANATIFRVSLALPTTMPDHAAKGRILAGKLPYATSTTVGPTTTVVASVNAPMANLNNVGNISFAGLYNNGGCVPVPTCPLDSTGTPLTPQIMVVPASISGSVVSGSTEVYPMSSIAPFTKGPGPVVAGVGIDGCDTDTSGAAPLCYEDAWNGNPVPDGNYWRVCLEIITPEGTVVWDETTGMNSSMMVVTRCAPPNEQGGSTFDVWSST